MRTFYFKVVMYVKGPDYVVGFAKNPLQSGEQGTGLHLAINAKDLEVLKEKLDGNGLSEGDTFVDNPIGE